MHQAAVAEARFAAQEIVDISTAAMAIKYGELSREKPRYLCAFCMHLRMYSLSEHEVQAGGERPGALAG
jgi:hypothetical protein